MKQPGSVAAPLPPASPRQPLPRSPWRGLLLARALALIEERQPLDDTAELAAAWREGRDLPQRVLARAWRLGDRLGLVSTLQGLTRHAGWLAVLGLVLVLLSSAGMLQAVLGSGRHINVVHAFVAVLGLHALTLLLWLLSLPWRPEGIGLGRWFWRLEGGRGPPERQALLAAGLELLQQQGLGRWLLGALSHGLWAMAFALALLWLALVFSFQAYELSWETTILPRDTLPEFVDLVGRWPAWLGLPVASTERLVTADAAERHRLLAWWLMLAVVAWGLLPRLLLCAVCTALARWRLQRLAPDTAAPWVRRLASRFAALQASAVIDADEVPNAPVHPSTAATRPRAPLALVGFELPPEQAWPPPDLATPAAGPPPTLCLRLDGGAHERQQVLAALDGAAIRSVLLVVDGGTSPDRGTGRFIAALQADGRRGLALWLLAGPAGLNERRWSAWLATLEDPPPAFDTPQAAAAWLAPAER